MSGFFFNLGRSVGSTMRQGNWMLASLTGSEADALRAEVEVGEDLARTMMTQMPPDEDAEVARFVNECGALLAGRVRDKGRGFCFRALRTKEANAFALPGGFVFVTRPLLELCEWDAHEVSFVLGHEMAHVLHGHAMQRVMQGLLVKAAGRLMPLRGLAGGLLFGQAAELVLKAYSREQEMDADLLGVKLVHSAGLDPRGAARLLARMSAVPTTSGTLAVYFATHPPFEERIAGVNRYLAAH